CILSPCRCDCSTRIHKSNGCGDMMNKAFGDLIKVMDQINARTSATVEKTLLPTSESQRTVTAIEESLPPNNKSDVQQPTVAIIKKISSSKTNIRKPHTTDTMIERIEALNKRARNKHGSFILR
ncbi:hypothetical protein GJ496_004466, partial [Pomphorhynchus laevis]